MTTTATVKAYAKKHGVKYVKLSTSKKFIYIGRQTIDQNASLTAMYHDMKANGFQFDNESTLLELSVKGLLDVMMLKVS